MKLNEIRKMSDKDLMRFLNNVHQEMHKFVVSVEM